MCQKQKRSRLEFGIEQSQFFNEQKRATFFFNFINFTRNGRNFWTVKMPIFGYSGSKFSHKIGQICENSTDISFQCSILIE